MTGLIHILIVEDSQPDTLLMVRDLRTAGYEVDFQRVATAEEMRSALASGNWDVIIADYSLPHFSGTDALKVLLESKLDIPFIVVSGSISEELAVQMMRDGAKDFILKQDLARLAPAVSRELRASEIRRQRRQAHAALRRSEENFRAMFNYTPAAIFAFDREGTVLQANSACEELFGHEHEEIEGRPMFETVAKPEDQPEIEQRIARVFSGESVENIEWLDTRPDGSAKWILTSITPICGPDGEIIMGLSLNVDITERKLAEEKDRQREQDKIEFYRRLVVSATNGKLVILERKEIENMAGLPVATWRIEAAGDLANVRHAVSAIAESDGMDERKIGRFMLAIGEACANGLKHAGGGTASLHRVPEGLLFVVWDEGPGIAALRLPEVALRQGYSTAGTLGMGYKVIIRLSDKVYLATGPDGTAVGIESQLHSSKEIPLGADIS